MKKSRLDSNLPDRMRIFLDKYSSVILILLILGISFVYGYQKVLFMRPQSIHSWRQCDGASLALSYYQEGMHFFKPQTQGLYSDGLNSGYTSPSEIPVLYFVVALLYKAFGYHEFLFKALDLLLFYIGLFYVFKLAQLVLGKSLYALSVPVLLFACPLIVYYANNFMPNTVALSFSLIGWYYFYSYSVNKHTRNFMLSMLFFVLAGAMKITELAGPIIIAGLMLADRFRVLKLDLGTSKQFFLKMGTLLIVFIPVTAWVLYAKYYNNLHGSTQFSTFTFPFWELDHDAKVLILHKMHVTWFKEYFYPPTFYFIAACLPITLIFYKRANRILLLASVLQFAGLIVYSFLWFQALGEHDYFYIGFYVLPVFLLINFFLILNSFNLSRTNRIIIQVAVIIFLIINVNYSRSRMPVRFSGWMNDYNEYQDVYIAKPYLQQIGVHEKDTVIFYPSPNIRPLYLMNLKGWTFAKLDSATAESHEKDSLMKAYIDHGAKYFITNDLKTLQGHESILIYTKNIRGNFGNLYIFKI
jgi:hypothetical protein